MSDDFDQNETGEGVYSINDISETSKDDDDDVLQQEAEAFDTSKPKAAVDSRSSFLLPAQRLLADERVLRRAIAALRLAIVCDGLNFLVLAPNYPLLVLPGGSPDSFESTAPLDFSAANYFIAMTAQLGAGLSSVFAGKASDKFGRRPMIVLNLFASTAFTLAKYFVRKNYWAFCAMSFVNGLFSSTLGVALAYVTDVYHNDRRKSDAEAGGLTALSVLGRAGGGIVAILFDSKGLFAPLWIAAALVFVAGVVCYLLLIEPNKNLCKKCTSDTKKVKDEDEEAPESLDQCTFWTIVVGALVDNFGSSGLVPICLSPLMFETYYVEFVEARLPPIMTETAYKWIYTLVAIVVIPGALASPWLFKKYGPPASCVVSNFFTGVVTVGLLYIARKEPPTTGTFAGFVVLLYAAFPLTIISQLSTAPMIDRIAPVDQRGSLQGLSMAVYNFGSALGPFLLGLLADGSGIVVCIWTCFGLSSAAALINAPLILHPRLSPAKKVAESDEETISSEVDEDLVIQNLSRGQYVPITDLFRVNLARADREENFLMSSYGKYSEETENEDKKVSLKELKVLLKMAEERLALLNQKPVAREMLAAHVNALWQDREATLRVTQEMGEWIGDYMRDNGYHPGEASVLFKHIIRKAFPTITKRGEVTPENMEARLLAIMRLLNNLIQLEDDSITSDVLGLVAKKTQ